MVMSEEEITRLHRIRKTVMEILRDRGYLVGDFEIDMTRYQFIQKYGENLKREDLILNKGLRSNSSDQTSKSNSELETEMTRSEFIQKFGEQNKLAVAMSLRLPSANSSSTFDFNTTGFFPGPERNTPGNKKTSLPTQQQTDNVTGHSYYKGNFSPESFGSYQDVMDALRRPVSSYSLVYEHPAVQKPIQKPKVHKDSSIPGLKRKRKLEFSSENNNNKAIVKATAKYKPVSKKNGGEKNNSTFPKNVKSLMETGMFDGVPVDYVSFSKGKLLRATIQGNVYLCGCDSCNNKKKISASEFEKHALGGCKTSHPNNHIRFENGKTMHEVVKQLQSTPANMLVDALLTVTGSPLNQEAFCAWRESYLATAKSSSQPSLIGG